MKTFALETRMANRTLQYQPSNESKPIRSVYDALVLSILSPIAEPDILKACRSFLPNRTVTSIHNQNPLELLDISYLAQRWMAAIGLYYATKRVVFDITLPKIRDHLYSANDNKPTSIRWLGHRAGDGALLIDISAVERLVMQLAVAINTLVDGPVQFEVTQEGSYGISRILEARLLTQLAQLNERFWGAGTGPAEQPKQTVSKSQTVDQATDAFRRLKIWADEVNVATAWSQANATAPCPSIAPLAKETVVTDNLQTAVNNRRAEIDATTTKSPQAENYVIRGSFGFPPGRAIIYNHLEGSVPIPSARHLDCRPETGESRQNPGGDVEAATETAASEAEDYEMVDEDQLGNEWEVV